MHEVLLVFVCLFVCYCCEVKKQNVWSIFSISCVGHLVGQQCSVQKVWYIVDTCISVRMSLSVFLYFETKNNLCKCINGYFISNKNCSI